MNITVPHSLAIDTMHQDVTLREVIAIFFRRLKGMTVIFSLAMIIALIWIFLIRTDMYEATAKILVRVGYEQATSVTAMDRQTPVIGYRYQDVATEVHILNSTDVLGKVVDKLNLTKMGEKTRPEGFFKGLIYDVKQTWADVKDWLNDVMIRFGLRERVDPRAQVIDALSQGLMVGSGQESNVFIAMLRLPYREVTASVLSAILDVYLETRMQYFQEDAAINVFRLKMDQTSEELKGVEAEIKKLEEEHNIVNFDVQEKLLLERDKQLESLLKTDRQELKALQDKLATLKTIHDSNDVSFASLGAFPQRSFAANLMSELAKIQDDRIRLDMAAGGGNQRSVSENTQRFNATLKLLKSNIQTIANEKESEIKGRVAAQKETQKALDNLHEYKTTWKNLLRRSNLLEADFKLYRKEMENASATSLMQDKKISNVKVIQHPLEPIRPAGIRKLYLIIIATVLSAFFAIAWASLTEFFDHRVYRTDQVVKHLGVPMIGVVPNFDQDALDHSLGTKGGVA